MFGIFLLPLTFFIHGVLVISGQNVLLPVYNFSTLSNLDNYYWDFGQNTSSQPVAEFAALPTKGTIVSPLLQQEFNDGAYEDDFNDLGYSFDDFGGLSDPEAEVFDDEKQIYISCPQCQCGLRFSSRIVGGSFARQREFPWMGLIMQRRIGFKCGGTVINDLYLVTAGQCVNNIRPRDLAVRLLELDRTTNTDSPSFEVRVQGVFVNPRYTRSNAAYYNDIALLKFRRRLTFRNFVRPICLPRYNRDFGGQTGLIAGWGYTVQGGPSTSAQLKRAVINIFTRRTCKASAVGRYLGKNMICAGFLRGGVDTCNFDIGGPLMGLQNRKYVLAGVTSWGLGCALYNRPGIYTETSRFLRWIYRKTRDACYCSN